MTNRIVRSSAPRKKALGEPTTHAGAGEVRIIGGQWKRTPLALVGSVPDLRPTPVRVRETLFNWLGQELSGWHCFDVFAGSGALGFEAASRGAASVVLCEQDSALVVQMKRMAERLHSTQIRVQRSDGVATLRAVAAGSIDLVFIDPPFDAALSEPALRAALRAVKPGGSVYLEAPQVWTDAALANALGADAGGATLSIKRHLRAGAVHAHWLIKREVATAIPSNDGKAMQPGQADMASIVGLMADTPLSPR